MTRQPENEAVIVRGVLDGGQRLEWRASESATIYVGTDPRCQWRVTADGVAPFHWHLCWYARRLWMSELGPGHAGAGGQYKWQMAPVGVVLRLGSAVLLFEMGADDTRGAAGNPGRARPSDPTLMMGVASAEPGAGAAAPGAAASGDGDPDATQIVAPDDLRALPPYGPSRASARLAAMAPPAELPPAGSPALEDMFIVPAHQAAPPAQGPGLFSRVTKVVPARMLIALVAAGSMAVISFLPESHAEHEPAPPASMPPRRPPPEVTIEMHAVQPDEDRAADEAAAARDLAAGRLKEAAERYRELQEAAPDDPVFRDFSAVIERRVKSRCPAGGCGEGSR